MTKLDLIKEQREQLPTFEYKQELVDAIREYNILVIIGETGSGKTTQIPQYILEEMPEVKKIGVTQPRLVHVLVNPFFFTFTDFISLFADELQL